MTAEVLAICRDYGQWPHSWDGLDRGEKVLLLADWRIRQQRGR